MISVGCISPHYIIVVHGTLSSQSLFSRLFRSLFPSPPRAFGLAEFAELFFPLEPDFGLEDVDNLFGEPPAGRGLKTSRVLTPGGLDGPEGLLECAGLSCDHSFL
jgi:hypothetical protein